VKSRATMRLAQVCLVRAKVGLRTHVVSGCMTHKKSDVGQAGSTMADGVVNAVIELAGLRVLDVTYLASPLDSGHFVST
jgi:hypothetical protein